MPRPIGIMVMAERCKSCLYRLKYPKETRDRILSEVARNDGYVECHTANGNGMRQVMCRGFADAQADCVPLAFARSMEAIDRVTYIHTTTGERDKPDEH